MMPHSFGIGRLALSSCVGIGSVIGCGEMASRGSKGNVNVVIDGAARVANPQHVAACATGTINPTTEALVADVPRREFHGKTVLRFEGFAPCSAANLASNVIRVEFASGNITCSRETSPDFIGCSFVGPNSGSLESTSQASLILKLPPTSSQVLGDGPGVQEHPAPVGDFNGDGKTDIAFVFQMAEQGLHVRTKFSLGEGKWVGKAEV